MDFDRGTTDEYIMLDWVGRGRFTHYPSGDTCLRHEYMVSTHDGRIAWDEKLTAFFARHPEAKIIVSGRYRVLDNVDNLPQSGGGFEVGDTVMVRDEEDLTWSHKIVSSEDVSDRLTYRNDPTTMYILDDGSKVCWDALSNGWFAFEGSQSKDNMRVRKPFEGEPTPNYDEAHAQTYETAPGI